MVKAFWASIATARRRMRLKAVCYSELIQAVNQTFRSCSMAESAYNKSTGMRNARLHSGIRQHTECVYIYIYTYKDTHILPFWHACSIQHGERTCLHAGEPSFALSLKPCRLRWSELLPRREAEAEAILSTARKSCRRHQTGRDNW